MNSMINLIDMLVHFSTFNGLICTMLLLLRLKDGDRSRLFLAISFGIPALMILTRSILIPEPTVFYSTVLGITQMNLGFISVSVLFLYPIEVVNPHSLNLKRAILLFLPSLILLAISILFKHQFRPLTSFQELIQYIHEPNVIFRLFILSLFFPILFALFYLPYSWSESRVSYRWIRIYSTGIQGIAVLYILYMLTGSIYVLIAHKIYCLAYAMIVTYQEIYLRLPASSGAAIRRVKLVIAPQREGKMVSPLWEKLIKRMNEEALWRNPDISLVDLSVMIGTNRTTLSNLIKEEGYDGFYAFINTFRIREFMEIIKTQEIKGIHETFYDVGFRSKATAIRYFKQKTGTTPSEYLQKMVIEKKES